MKHKWKKAEKAFYLPKNKPESIVVPKFNFYSIQGKGNPNDSFFAEYIGVLYALSYAVKMSPRGGTAPGNYYDYTVYPLEGVWDIDAYAKAAFNGVIDKNRLVFNLMIRQPGFVTPEYALETIEKTKLKKPHELLEKVKFETIEDGDCVHMLHLGSYDSEPESFAKMERFAREQHLRRLSRQHREIYLTDARRTSPEKQKTVLRFQVEK